MIFVTAVQAQLTDTHGMIESLLPSAQSVSSPVSFAVPPVQVFPWMYAMTLQ